MESVYPYCDTSPEVEGFVPVIFAQPRQKGFFLGIEKYAYACAYEHIARRREDRIIVCRAESARMAEHKFAYEVFGIIASKSLYVVSVYRHKAFVHSDNHYAQKEAYACGYHFLVTAKRVDKPPQEYGESKHMEYAEFDYGIHIESYNRDYARNNSCLNTALEIASRERAGDTAKQCENPHDDFLYGKAKLGI